MEQHEKKPYGEDESFESGEFKEPFPGGYKLIQARALEMIDNRMNLIRAASGPDDPKISELEEAKEMLSEPFILYKADQLRWKERIAQAENANEVEEELSQELAESVLPTLH